MDPLTAGITAGASVIGGITNAVGQGNLNRKNRQWTEQQNTIAYERQMEMQRQQNEWSAAQVDKQNNWNSYANQASLMEEAGINPAVMYGWNGSSAIGTATQDSAPEASTGGVNSSTGVPSQQSGMSHIGSAISGVVPQIVSFMQAREQIQALQLANDNRRMENERLAIDLDDYKNGSYYQTGSSSFDSDGNPVVESVLMRSPSGRRRKTIQEMGSIEGMDADNTNKRIESRLLDKTIEMYGTISSVNNSQVRLNDAQRDKLIHEATLLQKDIENYIKTFGGPLGSILGPISTIISAFVGRRR